MRQFKVTIKNAVQNIQNAPVQIFINGLEPLVY